MELIELTGFNSKKECLMVKDGSIQWADTCDKDRRHACFMDLRGGACEDPYYNLDKCVKFFPEAGLLTQEDAEFYCAINGGVLPEVARVDASDEGFLDGMS